MNFDVKGIDIDGISKMSSAIETYKVAIEKSVDNIVKVDPKVLNKAIKGDVAQTQYKAAVSRVQENAKALVRQLDSFKTVLDTEIKTRYESGQSNVSSTAFDSVK